MKRCSDCGVPKKLDDYHRSASHKDGRTSQCKVCHSAYCKRKRNVTCEDCGVEYYKRNRYASCPHCLKPKKVCAKCKKRKYITQFYKNVNAKDGRQSTCVLCRASKQEVRNSYCDEHGCVYFKTCKDRVKDRTFDPYCFVTSKYHGLYEQEYAA